MPRSRPDHGGDHEPDEHARRLVVDELDGFGSVLEATREAKRAKVRQGSPKVRRPPLVQRYPGRRMAFPLDEEATRRCGIAAPADAVPHEVAPDCYRCYLVRTYRE